MDGHPAGVSLFDAYQSCEMRTRESPSDQWGSKPGLEAGLPSSEAHPLSHVARSSLRLPRSLCAVLQETQGGTREVRRASQLQNHILRGASRSWGRGGTLASEVQSEPPARWEPRYNVLHFLVCKVGSEWPHHRCEDLGERWLCA